MYRNTQKISTTVPHSKYCIIKQQYMNILKILLKYERTLFATFHLKFPSYLILKKLHSRKNFQIQEIYTANVAITTEKKFLVSKCYHLLFQIIKYIIQIKHSFQAAGRLLSRQSEKLKIFSKRQNCSSYNFLTMRSSNMMT